MPTDSPFSTLPDSGRPPPPGKEPAQSLSWKDVSWKDLEGSMIVPKTGGGHRPHPPRPVPDPRLPTLQARSSILLWGGVR